MDLKIEINGIDRTNRVQANSLRIKDNINQRVDVCHFTVKKTPDQDFFPQVGQEVIVLDDNVRIYGGIITNTSVNIESVSHAIYRVDCSDYTHLLNRMLVLERLRNKTVTEIFEFLLEKYDTEGFTINNVQGTQLIKRITFNRMPLVESINKLAEITGFSWYVDYNKDIHFFPKNQEPAPFNISDTSGNYIWNSLEIKTDFTQIRNTIFIEGGEEEGNERTEEFTAEGDEEERTYFRLAHKFSEMPVVLLNDVAVTVGVEFLNPDESFQAMWSFQEKYIRFTAGNIPAVNDVIKVTGIPLFRVVGRARNSESINQHGVWEFKIKDTSINSRDEARLRANAELEAYKQGVNEGVFTTYEKGLRSGQVITVNSPLRGVNESYLIQSVSFAMRTPFDGQWEITLATLRTVGIIDFLQQLIRLRDVVDPSEEQLINFLDFQDPFTVGDQLSDIFTTSPPYMWMPEDEGDDAATISANPTKTPMLWNKFTWESEA